MIALIFLDFCDALLLSFTDLGSRAKLSVMNREGLFVTYFIRGGFSGYLFNGSKGNVLLLRMPYKASF